MIKPENFRFRALFGRTAFLSYKDGASVGVRTRTEGVGGLYGIQFHHGCILSFKRIYRPVVTKTYPAEAVANFVSRRVLFRAQLFKRSVLIPERGIDKRKQNVIIRRQLHTNIIAYFILIANIKRPCYNCFRK